MSVDLRPPTGPDLPSEQFATLDAARTALHTLAKDAGVEDTDTEGEGKRRDRGCHNGAKKACRCKGGCCKR